MGSPSFRGVAARLEQMEARVEALLAPKSHFIAVLSGLTTLVFGLRLVAILESPAAGPDYGHYLIAANWYAGIDHSGEGPFDLPFVPLLVLALAPAMGKIAALQVLGPAAAAAMLPAAAYFLERWIPRWSACAAATTFVLWQPFSEFIAFGGPTNLFGIAFSLILYRVLAAAWTAPRAGLRPRRVDLAASLILFLIVSTHHLSTLMAGATLMAWFVLRLLSFPGERTALAWTVLRITAAAAALSVPYATFYLSLVVTDARHLLGSPFPADAALDLTAFLWSRHAELWLGCLSLALLSFARFRAASDLLPAYAAFLVVPPLLLLTVLASHPTRVMFFAQFPLVMGAALWTPRGTPPPLPRSLPSALKVPARAIAAVLLLIAVPILAVDVPSDERTAVTHYHQALPPKTFEAFDWISANSAPAEVVAVDAGQAAQWNDLWKGMATGWWLEGFANRRAIYEANLPLLPFGSKWDDARDANRLFTGDVVFEDGAMRVGDDFPSDDSAGPAVFTGYYADYHEFISLRVPRLYDANNVSYSLVAGADPRTDISWDGTGARVAGNYSGPGFSASRAMTFDSPQHRAALDLVLAREPNAGWTEFEMTLHIPPWVKANFSSLDQGVVGLSIPEIAGFSYESGELTFQTTNLTAPRVVSPVAFRVEGGVGVRWTLSGGQAAIFAVVSLTRLPTSGPPLHAVQMFSASEILARHQVSYLFVAYDSPSNAQRFERQPDRYERAFFNTATTIFRVL